jgi:hypothetical protein
VKIEQQHHIDLMLDYDENSLKATAIKFINIEWDSYLAKWRIMA